MFYENFISSAFYWGTFLGITSALALTKITFLVNFFRTLKATRSRNYLPLILIMTAILGTFFCDLTWILRCIINLYGPTFPNTVRVFFVRIAYAFLILEYQSLSFLVLSIDRKPILDNWKDKLSLLVSLSTSATLFYLAFFSNDLLVESERQLALRYRNGFFSGPFEMQLFAFIALFLLPLFTLKIAISAYQSLKNQGPTLIKQQIRVVTTYFVTPFLTTEFFFYILNFALQTPNYLKLPLIVLSSLIFTSMLKFFKSRLLRLRFVNSSPHVTSKRALNFVTDHAELIRHIQNSENKHEIGALSRQFFKDLLSIKSGQVQLHVRSDEHDETNTIEEKVINYLSEAKKDKVTFLSNTLVLSTQDLELDLYYDDTPEKRSALTLLHDLNAAVFVPLFCRDELIGALVISGELPEGQLIDSTTRDETILFASYVQSALVHIELSGARTIQQRYKQAANLVETGHRKLEHIRKTISRHLERSKINETGLVLYRSGSLVPANQYAKELLHTRGHTDKGCPLAQACKEIAISIEKYKTPKRVIVSHDGLQLCVSGSPSIEYTGTVITICNADLLETLKTHPSLIAERDNWEYLLCMGSNKAASALNSHLPGASKELLSIKLSLLKAALQNTPIWLSVHEQDVKETAHIIAQLAEHEEVHHHTIRPQTSDTDFITDLFGINPLVAPTTARHGLVEKCKITGTIVIYHVELLSIHAQDQLAAFLATGQYLPLHSQKEHTSAARIIFWSNGKTPAEIDTPRGLSKRLIEQIDTLTIPAPSALADAEFSILANGLLKRIAPQSMQQHVQMTVKELSALKSEHVMSLAELQRKIAKAFKARAYQTRESIEPTLDTLPSDVIVNSAMQLGRKALRDQTMMSALWKRFKNQNRIAQVLGVNRSSVSRRCKEFGLI